MLGFEDAGSASTVPKRAHAMGGPVRRLRRLAAQVIIDRSIASARNQIEPLERVLLLPWLQGDGAGAFVGASRLFWSWRPTRIGCRSRPRRGSISTRCVARYCAAWRTVVVMTPKSRSAIPRRSRPPRRFRRRPAPSVIPDTPETSQKATACLLCSGELDYEWPRIAQGPRAATTWPWCRGWSRFTRWIGAAQGGRWPGIATARRSTGARRAGTWVGVAISARPIRWRAVRPLAVLRYLSPSVVEPGHRLGQQSQNGAERAADASLRLHLKLRTIDHGAQRMSTSGKSTKLRGSTPWPVRSRGQG